VLCFNFRDIEELNPALYDISLSSKDKFDYEGLLHNDSSKQGTVSNIVEQLEKLYCGPLTAEFEHLPVSCMPYVGCFGLVV
jgi:2-oxoglutarate dehydrogenase complex dehydrogenase (E1) component-like enzyme